MGDKSSLETLLQDMREQVVYAGKASMPIPLYERIKDATASNADALREVREALVDIADCCGTISFSSHKQMREAIEGSMELAESAIEKLGRIMAGGGK